METRANVLKHLVTMIKAWPDANATISSSAALTDYAIKNGWKWILTSSNGWYLQHNTEKSITRFDWAHAKGQVQDPTFKREDRYIVIKRSDLDLVDQANIENYLNLQKIPKRECVVIESDWPIYDQAWDMVKQLWESTPLPDNKPNLSGYSPDCRKQEEINRVSSILYALNSYCQLNRIGKWGDSASEALMSDHARLLGVVEYKDTLLKEAYESLEQYKAAEQLQIGLRQRSEAELKKLRDELPDFANHTDLEKRNAELCGYLESYAQILREALMSLPSDQVEKIARYREEIQAVEIAKAGYPSPQLIQARIRDILVDWRAKMSDRAALLKIVDVVEGK